MAITTTTISITTTINIRASAREQQPHTLRCRHPHRQHRYDARAAHCNCIAARLTAGTPILSLSALRLTITAGMLGMALSG